MKRTVAADPDLIAGRTARVAANLASCFASGLLVVAAPPP